METKRITKRLSSQLLGLQKELRKLNKFDEFSLLKPSAASIENFDFFANLIEGKAKIYDTLRFLIEKARRGSNLKGDGDQVDPVLQSADFFRKQGLRLSDNRSHLHFSTFEKIQSKMKQIFALVEDYLDQLEADLHQEHFQSLLEANLTQLRQFLGSEESASKKISQVDEQFQEIEKTLKEKLKFERENLLRMIDESENKVKRQLVGTRDKAVMVIEKEEITTKVQKSENLEMNQIKLKIDADEVACKITEKPNGYYGYICFSGENSYLSALNQSGLSVKKDGEIVYSKESNPGQNNIGEVVYCKKAYFIFSYAPGKILRKTEDSSDPVVWWSKRKISHFWNLNKNIRVNKEQSALIVNLNNTELQVIEVKDDGTAGRELIIQNDTGNRVNCHEALTDRKLLVVKKRGLLEIYEVDYANFSQARLLTSAQIALNTGRDERQFWLAVCENSKLCAVQVGEGELASRILIYKLQNEAGESSLTYMTQLDIYDKRMMDLGNGCFSSYIGGNLILCAHSKSSQTAYAFGYNANKNKITIKYVKGLEKGKYCLRLERVGNEVRGLIDEGGFILKFKFGLFVAI